MALTDNGASSKKSSILTIVYITGFVGLASYNLMIPIMPLYAAKLGASVSEVGLIVAAFSYCTALFVIPFGLLSDRYGRRTFLISGLATSTVVSFLYLVNMNLVQLSVLRAVHGLSSAIFMPSLMASVIDLAPAEQRGKAIGWYTTATQCGLMLGPVLGGYLTNSFGFEAAFAGSGILMLAGLITVIARFNLLPQKEVAKLDIDVSWSWLKQKAVYGTLLSPITIAFGLGVLGAYIPIYADGFGINATGAGLIIMLSYASSAALRAIAGTLSDRIGRKPMILGGLLFSTIMMALFSQVNSLLLLSILAFCFGIGLGIVQPSGMALMADLSNKKTVGVATSMFSTAVQVGMAVGPTAMGVVAGVSNLETMFCASSLSMVVGVLISFILFQTGRSAGGIR